MAVRAPLPGLPPAPGRSVELLTWKGALPPGVISNPVPPIRQRDWPNPVLRRPDFELRKWINGLPPGVISNPVPPIRQRDWPNPTLRRQDFELRKWLNGLPPGVIANPVPPILQRDWPNPAPQRQNLELRTWVQWQQIPQPAAQPFAQYDWPNPAPARQNLELRSWTQGIPLQYLSLTIPPNQYDWPNPILRVQNLELRTWRQELTPSARQIPTNQYDWPNPVLAKPDFTNRTWSFWQQIQPPVALPFSQYDWPNPAPLRPNYELRSWFNPTPIAELVAVPNVVGETQAQAQTDITAVGLTPTVQTAYSNSVAAGLVISQDPAAGTFVGPASVVTIVVSLGPQPVTAELPAGTAKRRRRTLYFVTVDGQTFEFSSYEAAVAWLRKAKEAAQELADRAIEDAVARQSTTPVEVPLPTFKMPEITASSRDLRQEITVAKREIATIYDHALRNAETAILFELVKRKQEEDEEIFWLF
jgi:hypothetical protein